MSTVILSNFTLPCLWPYCWQGCAR